MATDDLAANQRYNRTARLLHWIIAALVIAQLLTGLLHDALEKTVQLMPVHKALGLTVLALVLVRLGWRLTWRAPPWPISMSGLTQAAARAVHALFYVLLVALPLSGWLFSSASARPLTWFGLFAVPKFSVTKPGAVYGISHEGHELLGWLMLAMVVLHVAAALRHQYLLKDGVLQRML